MAELQPDALVFHVLQATPKVVQQMLQSAPANSTETPVDDGWSAKDVLAHLLDVDDVITERIRRIVNEDRPFIRSIDPPARIRDAGYTERPMTWLVDEFESRRTADLEFLRSLAPDQLLRVGDHGEAGEISGANLAWQWAYHDLMHIEQMSKIIQDTLLAGMGNTRRFYFDV